MQTALLLFFTGKISRLRLSLTSNPLHHLRTQPLTLTCQFYSCLGIRSPQDSVQLSKQGILLRSHHPHLASQRMFIHTCSHNHQYCQPLPHCRPVSSHSQGSIISPLLKKPTLNKEELFNYRPISNLSLISKILECVVKSGFMDHLTSNSLLNSHQSAYCKTSFYRNSSFVRPRSPRQCNRITKSITPLLTRPICCFRHY